MKINTQENNAVTIIYTISFEKQEIETAKTTAISAISKDAKVDGFRKGNVPLDIIKKKYSDSINKRYINDLIKSAMEDVYKTNKGRVMSEPHVKITKLEEDEMELEVTVENFPELDAETYKKVKIDKKSLKITEDEMDDLVSKFAKQFIEYHKVEDESHKTIDQDKVNIDFLGKVDGVPFDGGKAEGYDLILGSNSFIPGFEDQLIGHKSGSEVLVKVKFPEDYQAEDLKGKDATFDVKINFIQTAKIPEINDELAKKAGEESLEALKDSIKTIYTDQFNSYYNLSIKDDILSQIHKLLEKTDLPETLVKSEIDSIKQSEEHASKGKDHKDHKPLSEDEIKAQATERSILALAMSHIADIAKVTVSDQEVDMVIDSYARNYPGQEELIRGMYKENKNMLSGIKANLMESKIIKYVVDNCTVNKNTEITLKEHEKELQAKREEQSA